MTTPNRDLLSAWLVAEASRSEELAEAALTSLLQRLPDDGPSAAFAERVLERVRSEREPSRSLVWAWRLTVAACLVLVAGSVVVLPAVFFALPLSIGSVVSFFADAFVVAAGWLGRGLMLWQALIAFAEKVALVVATPQAGTAVFLSVAIGIAAFRLLFGLTMQDRRSLHVSS
jgi:hypothetical protein